MHLGIDYGSKLAGTTVICFLKANQLQFLQSEKKKDADAFISRCIDNLQPQAIYLDAPLSLPSAYFDRGEDYFYRQADRELKAMSPMFLGGLTARAMRLQKQWDTQFPFFEVYPAALRRLLLPDFQGYKKERSRITDFNTQLALHLPVSWATPPQNWHQVDAALAWLSGERHRQNKAIVYGDQAEGQIWI